MLLEITATSPHGLPMAAPAEGVVPPAGPVVALEFTLALGGPVPNVIEPPAPQSCQASSANVALRALVVDQDGDPVDLAAATMQFWLLAPSGAFFPVPASLVNNGLDGLMQYVTGAEDLPQAGLWGIQGQLTFAGRVLETRWAFFAVEPNVPDF